MNENNISVSDLYNAFSKKSETIQNFAALLTQIGKTPIDYGSGTLHTMTEMHLLTAIADNPGITVTELAAMKGKTPSAISQIIKKLDQKGYLERNRDDTHKRKVLYFVTEPGKRQSDLHKQYDVGQMSQLFDILGQWCSPKELDNFFHVVERYVAARGFQEEIKERKSNHFDMD